MIATNTSSLRNPVELGHTLSSSILSREVHDMIQGRERVIRWYDYLIVQDRTTANKQERYMTLVSQRRENDERNRKRQLERKLCNTMEGERLMIESRNDNTGKKRGDDDKV